jgi:hypothetical protein
MEIKMKKYLVLGVIVLGFLGYKICFAETVHCQATYLGKPFVQATIWSNLDGFGPAECDYKNPNDKTITPYHFPKHEKYYSVSGQWRSTMPGFKWCTIENGDTYESCRFAKREQR